MLAYSLLPTFLLLGSLPTRYLTSIIPRLVSLGELFSDFASEHFERLAAWRVSRKTAPHPWVLWCTLETGETTGKELAGNKAHACMHAYAVCVCVCVHAYTVCVCMHVRALCVCVCVLMHRHCVYVGVDVCVCMCVCVCMHCVCDRDRGVCYLCPTAEWSFPRASAFQPGCCWRCGCWVKKKKKKKNLLSPLLDFNKHVLQKTVNSW
jgi:hypothetical protein